MPKRTPKKAIGLHLVEKGLHSQNLKLVSGSPDMWDTGNWWIGDKTAADLVGKNIHLHAGQLEPSHLGGEVVSFQTYAADPKRKVFRFRKLDNCLGVSTPKENWTNEKKVVWQK